MLLAKRPFRSITANGAAAVAGEDLSDLIARIEESKSKRLFEAALDQRSGCSHVVIALAGRSKYLNDVQYQRIVALLVEDVKRGSASNLGKSFEGAIFTVLGGNEMEVNEPRYRGGEMRYPSTSDAVYLFTALGASRGDWEVGVLSLVFGRPNGGRSISLNEAQLTKRIAGARSLCEMLDWLETVDSEKARSLRHHVALENLLLGPPSGHTLMDEYHSLIVRLEGSEFFAGVAGPGDNHAAHAIVRREYLLLAIKRRFGEGPEAEVAVGLAADWHLGLEDLYDTAGLLCRNGVSVDES